MAECGCGQPAGGLAGSFENAGHCLAGRGDFRRRCWWNLRRYFHPDRGRRGWGRGNRADRVVERSDELGTFARGDPVYGLINRNDFFHYSGSGNLQQLPVLDPIAAIDRGLGGGARILALVGFDPCLADVPAFRLHHG